MTKSFQRKKVIIEAPALSDAIQQSLKFAQQLDKNKVIRAKKEEEIYLLDTAEIQRVYIENRQVWAETATDNYHIGLPLYQVLELLPADFLQISQSEIINTSSSQRRFPGCVCVIPHLPYCWRFRSVWFGTAFLVHKYPTVMIPNLTGSGLIQITLKNGQITYSSRRYLKAIKEKLQL